MYFVLYSCICFVATCQVVKIWKRFPDWIWGTVSTGNLLATGHETLAFKCLVSVDVAVTKSLVQFRNPASR